MTKCPHLQFHAAAAAVLLLAHLLHYLLLPLVSFLSFKVNSHQC
jgi:hypothetical protein